MKKRKLKQSKVAAAWVRLNPRRIKSPRFRALVFILLFALVGSGILYFALAGSLINTDETSLYNYTNSYRQQHGLSTLSRSACLTDEARAWAKHLATTQHIHHPDPINNNDSSDIGLAADATMPHGTCSDQWLRLTQNVGDAGDVSSVWYGFIGSPEHLANIVDTSVNMMGEGVYRDDNGRIWAVQTFARCIGCDSTWTNQPGAAGETTTSIATLGTMTGLAQKSDGTGFWTTDANGKVIPHNTAFYGDMSGRTLNKPIVGMAAKPDGTGYWLVGSDGGIFSFGSAGYFGSTGGMILNKPIVGIASTPSGNGYWLVAADGGIFTFGDAGFYGSTGNIALNRPIIGMTRTPSGGGYWLYASDGGIFTFGNAGFYGSTGGMTLNKPIVGMAAAPNGQGYWLVASDGGVFTFGNIQFYGSAGNLNLPKSVIGILATPDSAGYAILQSDGTPIYYGSAHDVLGEVVNYVNTPPSVPANLHLATTPTTSSVAIAWNAATDNRGVQGYKIYRGGIYIGSSSGLSYIDNNVSSSRSYSYQVSAYDYEGGVSALSSAISATTQNTPPSIPQNLHMTSRTVSSISLSWNASTDDVAVVSYNIYRNGTRLGSVTGLNYSDTNLKKGTTFKYQVQAVDGRGALSSLSSTLSATTCKNTVCK